MTKHELDELRIERLIYKLNHIATQRKELYDQLWAIEESAIQVRVELLKVMDEKGKCGTTDLHGE